MDEFDEKISLYHAILELEDWLEIKHNPNILKQALDTMENYHSDLERMRDEVVYSELEEDSSMMGSEIIDDSEKTRQIEEAYKELDEIWAKEAEEKSGFYEELPEPDLSYLDYDEEDAEYQKPKKTEGNRISIIKMNGSTIIEESSKVIQSEDGKFGLYDIRFYQKGGLRVYKEYLMLFHKEFLIDDIKSITFDKSENKVKIKFNNWQKLSQDSSYPINEMVFYVQFSNLYIDCYQGDTRIDHIKCLFDKTGYGLDHLFEGFCSLADLEEGCAIMMVNGNAYINSGLSYFYNESEAQYFSQLSETIIFHL